VPLTPLQQQQLQRQSQLFELQRLQQQQQQQQQQQRLPPQMTPDAVNSTQYRHSSPLQSTSQYANNMTALQQQHGQSIPSRIIPADTFTRLYPQFCHQCQLNPPQMPIVEYYRLYAQCQLVGGFPAIRQNLQLAGRVMASSTYFAQSTNLAQFLQFYQTYLYDFEVYARRLITEQQNRVAARHVDGGVAVGSAVPSPHASPQQRVRMPSVSASSSTNQPPTKPSLTPSQQPSQLVKKRKERVRRPIESYGGIEVDKMNRLLNGAGEGFTRRELACKEDLGKCCSHQISSLSFNNVCGKRLSAQGTLSWGSRVSYAPKLPTPCTCC
jgi:hypothetical protein